MSYLSYFLLFIFGLAVGSFLNVVIFRYRPGERLLSLKTIGGPGSSKKRSQCLSCEKKLNWYELIPLFSFIIQNGKCRGCGAAISFQYFLVELLSGLIFVFVPMFWAAALPLLLLPSYISMFAIISFIWISVFLIFIVLSAIDLKHFIIPDSVNLTLAVLGAILLGANFYFKKITFFNGSFLGSSAAFLSLTDNIFINYIFAAAVMMVFFGLIIFITKGKGMGWGDFKLVGALGLIFGWPDILAAVFLAFIIGALVSLVFVCRKKKGMKDIIPFGPFLVLGASLVFFFGGQIMDWYFKLLSGF
ncbi:MAG: prepilin peptidase [Candidatus Paceibacterota bacterium]